MFALWLEKMNCLLRFSLRMAGTMVSAMK